MSFSLNFTPLMQRVMPGRVGSGAALKCVPDGCRLTADQEAAKTRTLGAHDCGHEVVLNRTSQSPRSRSRGSLGLMHGLLLYTFRYELHHQPALVPACNATQLV